MEESPFDERDPEELFLLDIVVGHGHFGKVYKAQDKQTQKDVAIKILTWNDEDEANESMKQEIALMKGCNTPSIVQFYGSFLKKSDLWIVMELCDGGSALNLINHTTEGLPEPPISVIMKDMLTGLAYLHERRMLHRDIKADNVLLTTTGLAKLADLGVAAQLTNTMDNRNTATGTPYWMAPELIMEHGYSSAVDIWSLGITAIECAEKRPPFYDMQPMKALFTIATGEHAAPSITKKENFSDDFHDFIAKCLVKDPEKRATAVDLLKHPFIINVADRSVLIEKVEEFVEFRERKKIEKEMKRKAMAQRRKSIKQIMGRVSKIIPEPVAQTTSSQNVSTICLLDGFCAVKKELTPWSFPPIFTHPIKDTLVSKIDDEKMELLYNHIRDPRFGLERKTRSYRFRSHKDCFVASEAIDWFMRALKLDSREEAVAVGEALTHRGLIQHVSRGEPFADSSSLYKIVDLKPSALQEHCAEGELTQLLDVMWWGLAKPVKWRGKTYEAAFFGVDGVEYLQEKLSIEDRSAAVQMATVLQERCFYHRVDFKESFSEKALYKFFKNDKKWVDIPSTVKTAAYKKANAAFDESNSLLANISRG